MGGAEGAGRTGPLRILSTVMESSGGAASVAGDTLVLIASHVEPDEAGLFFRTGAYDQDAASLQSVLPRFAHLRQQQVSRVTFALVGSQGHDAIS